jgi:hypothetical protein
MPLPTVGIRFRHAARMGRDVIGQWHHNGARWPLVALILVLIVAFALLVI